MLLMFEKAFLFMVGSLSCVVRGLSSMLPTYVSTVSIDILNTCTTVHFMLLQSGITHP